MLKTVSSITNAIGALNFKGTWDANANSPALTSSVGTKGDYYVVGTAGSTNLNVISNWGVGDLATFNGSVWQRVEGGADLNGVNLSVSGTSTLSGLTASTALALNASKEIVSVTNTGTGDNVLATAPTLVGDVTLSTGNLVVADTKGIDFSATPGTGTSELFDDYEEGTFVPQLFFGATQISVYNAQVGRYTKIGNTVYFTAFIQVQQKGAGTGAVTVRSLPFTSQNTNSLKYSFSVTGQSLTLLTGALFGVMDENTTQVDIFQTDTTGGVALTDAAFTTFSNDNIIVTGTYQV
jgi:hypothetical protein